MKSRPVVHKDCYIAPTAAIIGDVTIEDGASVWEYAVLRADLNHIHIGPGSNVQDCAIMHVTKEDGVEIGRNVTIGHGAIVHCATVEDECIIGMNAVVLDKAVVKRGSIVGAGAVVSPGTVIPEGSLALGIPARVVKSDPERFSAMARENAREYHILREEHASALHERLSTKHHADTIE